MEDIEQKSNLKGIIISVAVVLGLLVIVFLIAGEKKKSREHAAVVAAMDQELLKDEEGVKAQRQLVEDLSKEVEALRSQIQAGELKDGKAAVAQFETLAARQRSEREKFLQMAEAYNQKVAKFRSMNE